MSLPAGVYLTSGVGDAPGQPSFAEIVLPLENRETQWKRIVQAKVDSRNCSVFKTPADFIASSLETKYRRERNQTLTDCTPTAAPAMPKPGRGLAGYASGA